MRRSVAVAVGIATLAFALGFGDPGRAWAAFVANVLFWFGLAAGAVTLSAVLTLSNARWAEPLRPEAVGWSRPLGVASLLLAAVPVGAVNLYPWARLPVPGLESWLAPEWLFARDLIAVALLSGVAMAFARTSEHRRGGWAVALILVYASAGTLLAWDLIMSLEPRWTNTLFGAYYFIGGAYAGLAMLALRVRGAAALTVDQRRDLGTLLFGFCMLWSYFLWSQYLVIWYGNLPREVGFWVARTTGGWEWIGVALILGGSVLPFVLLLSRRVKQDSRRLAQVAGVALFALWLERLLLFLPAVSDHAVVGVWELVVSAGVATVVLVSAPRPVTVSTSDRAD